MLKKAMVENALKAPQKFVMTREQALVGWALDRQGVWDKLYLADKDPLVRRFVNNNGSFLHDPEPQDNLNQSLSACRKTGTKDSLSVILIGKTPLVCRK